MANLVKNLVAGALALAALYTAYQVGKDAGKEEAAAKMAQPEPKEEAEQETPATEQGEATVEKSENVPDTKPARKNPIQKLIDCGRTLRKGGKFLSRFAKDPEQHQMVATMEGDELVIRVNKKGVD